MGCGCFDKGLNSYDSNAVHCLRDLCISNAGIKSFFFN